MEITDWLIVIGGYLLGIFSSFISKTLPRAYDKWMTTRYETEQLRKDLKGRILLFCDALQDIETIRQHVKNLSQELVFEIMQIRKSIRSANIDLDAGTITELKELTRLFLRVAGRSRSSKEEWPSAYDGTIKDICERLQKLANSLS